MVDVHRLHCACPKDGYPLLRIDQIADETLGHDLFNFMVHSLAITKFR